MEWFMERQAPFLKSVLQEANQHQRQELLRMANADQINAISELVMNTIRGTVPRSRHTISFLKPQRERVYPEFTSHGQTRVFGETTTPYHDGSKRRKPLVRIIPML